MEKIVFATNNQHKLNEIKSILGGKFEVVGLKDLGFDGDIPETGMTLKENASIKSKFAFEKFKLNCFSDDTGLEIDALNGKPGVFSARYAGEEANPENNIKKVLHELISVSNRKARFKTVISLLMNGKEYFFEGKVEGQIITEKKGTSGFGYDPIFIPDGYSQTFAELDMSVKNQISHRAKATSKLVAFLLNNF